MIPAPFEYLRPSSVEEAIDLLRGHGQQARLLAGGQSLVPLMKMRLASPGYLIDLARIRGLSYIREEAGAICLGPLTTHAEIAHSDVLKARWPLLAAVASRVGDLQVRNLGTIGGSLAHAHPAADLPAAVLALEAEMLLRGPDGCRTVPAADFFTGMFSTALRADEVLVEIRIPPLPDRAGAAYSKVEDKASHFALVGVAAVVSLDEAGICRDARVAVTGVTTKAYRAQAVERALLGTRLDEQAVAGAARSAVAGAEPLSDLFASSEYRVHLTQVYTARVLQQAAVEAATG